MLRLAPLLLATQVASPAPASPAPAAMALEVQPSEGRTWKLVATNIGDEMLRFAADARLLRLEVTPPEPLPSGKLKPKAPKTIECSLPKDFRPSGVAPDRAVILEPGAVWEEAFDPALYCFGERERAALVPGARVVVKIGFPAPTVRVSRGKLPPPPPPPYLAEPTALDSETLGLKELAADPLVLDEDFEPADPPLQIPPKKDDPDPKAPRIEVSTPGRLDAANERAIVLSTTVRNAGKRSMLVHLRPDQLFFDVEGPTGLYRCGPAEAPRAVPRDFFSNLAPGKTRTFQLRLMEACPTGTFDRPGLYRVRAGIVVQDGGADPRWGAFQGSALANTTTFVRVRNGARPFYLAAPQIKEAE